MTAINSKEHAEKNGLAGAADASFVVARQHPKSGPLVIVAVHPGDGEEMRHLPDENDREKSPGAEIERIASGRPADQRRERARNRADQSVAVLMRFSGV